MNEISLVTEKMMLNASTGDIFYMAAYIKFCIILFSNPY